MFDVYSEPRPFSCAIRFRSDVFAAKLGEALVQ